MHDVTKCLRHQPSASFQVQLLIFENQGKVNIKANVWRQVLMPIVIQLMLLCRKNHTETKDKAEAYTA
jgi:hypothetical protein